MTNSLYRDSLVDRTKLESISYLSNTPKLGTIQDTLNEYIQRVEAIRMESNESYKKIDKIDTSKKGRELLKEIAEYARTHK